MLAQSENDTVPVIYSWRLENFFLQTQPAEIDTNLTNFQVYYPNYQYSVSNSFLGNLGTASISNIVSDRIFIDDAFFINSFMPYFHSAENTQYYNTRKQFSRLSYTYGAIWKEETFEAFHTQNLTSKINIGFRYYNISSRGQYKYQKVKNNSFRLFGSYTGQQYMLHTSFNMNYYRNNENGGIIDSVFQSGNYRRIIEIPTLFNGTGTPNFDSDAQNRVRYLDLLISQRLKLFTLASKVDSSDTKRGRTIAEPVLSYVFRINRSTKTYSDTDPVTPGFYNVWYFNTRKTSDSIANLRISNILQLEFKTTFRKKVQTGIYGLAGYDFDKYYFFSEWDTQYTSIDTNLTPIITENNDTMKGIDRSDQLTNLYVSTGIYGNFWNRVKARFSGTFYLIGQKSGQTEISGLINTDITLLKREYQLDIEGIIENKKPGYLLENYYSNHYMWEQELEAQNGFRLSGKLRSPSNQFELRGNYHLLHNFIYFNELALPRNYEYILNYISFEAIKTFKFWKIYSVSRVVYQVTENKSVLPIPDLVIYNSTYFDHTFRFKLTNGTIQTIFGLDTYYNTSFNGYEYTPALGLFYVQNNESIGNYPLLDLFLNIKLKRTRFFAKLQHFNSLWFEQRYYSTCHYPYNQYAIKFGLSWVFYD